VTGTLGKDGKVGRNRRLPRSPFWHTTEMTSCRSASLSCTGTS